MYESASHPFTRLGRFYGYAVNDPVCEMFGTTMQPTASMRRFDARPCSRSRIPARRTRRVPHGRRNLPMNQSDLPVLLQQRLRDASAALDQSGTIPVWRVPRIELRTVPIWHRQAIYDALGPPSFRPPLEQADLPPERHRTRASRTWRSCL